MTISRVGTPSAPTEAFGTSVSRNCGTVVTGQLVNITLAGWNDTTNPTITAGFLTKTAGTATIGTVTLDRTNSGNNGDGSFSWNAQWSFVVTSGGTLTVTAAGFPSSGGGSSLAISHAGAETTLSWADDSSRVEDANGQHTATDGASALSSGDATSAGEAWFVGGLTLNNGAAVTVTTPSGFSAITDNGANGASVEVLAHADDIVTTGTTQAAAWTFSALDGASYNGQAATVVVYKEAAPTTALEQEGFRFGLDDGSESAHTWAAGQDANITAPAGQTRVLNMLVNVTGNPGAKVFKLQFRKVGDPGWSDLPIQ